ncbi:phytanoyl-CoA dioxygenase family protein [Microlunatus sp. GCM10028923]|uniref:phytanoyl-CoA dioxygenase family protein n=1 Tax=Microlunatus sp. GCM10028923 TaxID=3273400 RepID=UPI003619508D
MTTTAPDTDLLDTETIADYRRDGFVRIKGVLTPEEVERFRDAAQQQYETGTALNRDDQIFKQVVNVWTTDETLRDLTLHPKLARLATELAGLPVRIWHDHLLIKKPHNQAPTEFHQDAPYWPHANCRHSLSAWVALVDVPVERGCMTFIPEQHERRDIRPIDLTDAHDLFEAAPDLTWHRRVTIPLQAGDVTFHNGYTPHTANSNDTDEFRYAHVNIYADRELTYDGKPHVCTDPLNLTVGQRLPDDHFPPVG